MSKPARRTRGGRDIAALGFGVGALLIAALDYWTYHVLSSHGIVVGVSILIVSYVGFSFVLWLACVAARGLGLGRQGPGWRDRRRQTKPDDTPRSVATLGGYADVVGHDVGQGCQHRGHPQDRHVVCYVHFPLRRQASA